MNKETKSAVVLGVIFAVLAAAAYYYVHKTQQEVDAKKAEIASLKTQIDQLRAEAKRYDALVEELENLKVNFAQFVKILPAPEVATEEQLMYMLQEKCERAQFGLGNYRVAKPRRSSSSRRRGRKSGGFREIDVTLAAEATFQQFLRFLNSLERHETFLRVNSFNCTAGQKPEFDAEGNEVWPLKITLNISTFRYESGGK
ncbi:MAG: hypothetical protein D6731_15560 [Planctomycetota bacterium]|nr:MAG: hypothetical protein D6731_15560 [Planctomycetota bacterium]